MVSNYSIFYFTSYVNGIFKNIKMMQRFNTINMIQNYLDPYIILDTNRNNIRIAIQLWGKK